MSRFRRFVPTVSPPALRQAARTMAACAVAYAAYRLLGLKQGYWAVFTVLIVMQGSIGGTLGAAIDRMLGTFVGAALGAAGAALHGGGAAGTGAALVVVTGLGGYLATVRPQLKAAPVTASIMMLTMPAGELVSTFVIDRVIEITIGGVVGVLAMTLILPARSQVVVRARTAEALHAMRILADDMADAVADGEAASFTPALVALRPPLIAIEQALREADREHATWLARHAIPSSVPRTLWRARSDLVLAARALDPPLPESVRTALGDPAAALLRALGATFDACGAAMRSRVEVVRPDLAATRRDFADALTAFRASEAGATIDLDLAGHLFGLAFAIEELRRDLRDLADRIDEMNGSPPPPGRPG